MIKVSKNPKIDSCETDSNIFSKKLLTIGSKKLIIPEMTFLFSEIRRESIIANDPRDKTVSRLSLDFHYSYLDGTNGGTAVCGLLCHVIKSK